MPSASSYREAEGAALARDTPNGDLKPSSGLMTHEEIESVHNDLVHEVGSTSSTSTTSSLFSTNQNRAKMSHPNGKQNSTSLTPLSNIDSSPRANGAPSPSKPHFLNSHVSAGVSPKSPFSHHLMTAHESINPEASCEPLESALEARPGRGETKGYRATYDPALDKEKKKTFREAQYEPFGKIVRFTLDFRKLTLADIIIARTMSLRQRIHV